MANTYTSLKYHIVFSTKCREPWIDPQMEHRIWAYLGGIAKQNRLTPLQVGGTDDHVHILLGAPPVLAVSKIVQLLKGGSSAWVHDTFPALRLFGWQDGYGAFPVSQSNLPEVTAYIQNSVNIIGSSPFKKNTFSFCGGTKLPTMNAIYGINFNRRYAT